MMGALPRSLASSQSFACNVRELAFMQVLDQAFRIQADRGSHSGGSALTQLHETILDSGA
jgi:hypothetical protein